MASETYWVLKSRVNGEYFYGKCADGWCDWGTERRGATRYASIEHALGARAEWKDDRDHAWARKRIAIMRVTRRPKRDRLILTGEAARLVREWREESANYRANTIDKLHGHGFSCTSRLLAALASEEVRDG